MLVVTSSSSSSGAGSRYTPYRRRTGGGGGNRRRRQRNAWIADIDTTGHHHHSDEAEEVMDMPDEFDGNDLEAAAEDADVARFEPLKLPSRTHEHCELDQPQKRSECFGCVYVGERNTASIPYEDIMSIINIARQSLARTDLATMAIHMAQKYAKLRSEINRNLMPGEDPLPEWKASTILDHIRHHNQDPEVQQVVCIAEVQELREHALNACLERDEMSGNIRANKDQVACYERLTKLQFQLQRMDATKMAFYSGGAHLDPKTTKQGVFAMSGKNLRSYWAGVRDQ